MVSAVVETTSTLGGYKVFSSENATLATAISEVINELEKHNISLNQVQFVFTYGNSKYSLLAICRR